MKNKIGIIFILICSPFILSAQDSLNLLHQVLDLVTAIQEIESQFPESERRRHSVVLYSKADFSGDRIALDNDWSARSHQNSWNDEVASIEVPRGYEVWLYEHPGFRGRALVISQDWSVRDNPGWRKRISSIRLISPYDQDYSPPERRSHHRHDHCQEGHEAHGVTLYSKKDFSGASMTLLRDWSVSRHQDSWDDRISSMYIPEGYEVVLYEDSRFRGRSTLLKGTWSRRRQREFWEEQGFWHNRVSSIEIYETGR